MGGTSPPTAEEFAERLAESFRLFWLMAVGIVGDHALAEDVVQEASIIALGKLDQFQKGTNFRAWMGQIVRFVALNQRRRERVRRDKSPNVATMSSTGEAPSRGAYSDPPEPTTGSEAMLPMEKDEFSSSLGRALDEVSETARTCLLLRTVEGLEYAEIAAVLGIPEGTAMSHVHRTRRFLREKLGSGWA